MLPDMPPPAPRPFRFRAVGGAVRFVLLFGGILMTVGTIIAVVFTAVGGPFWDDLLLDRRGVTTRGAAGLIEPTSGRINRRPVHRVHYTFADAGGVEHAGSSQTTDPDRIARLWGPFDLPIDYDPRAPERSRLSGESSSLFGMLVLIPLAFAAVGAILVASGVGRVRAVRAIYIHGLPARADVTGVTPGVLRVNRRRVMHVDYAFDTLTGRINGSTTSLNPPPVGAAIWVLHLAAEPQRNVPA